MDHRDPLDPIEQALCELQAAERAGVFGRTRFELRSQPVLADADQVARPAWKTPRVFGAIAAALILAVGVWSAMFSWQIGKLKQQQAASMIAAAPNASAPDAPFPSRDREGADAPRPSSPGALPQLDLRAPDAPAPTSITSLVNCLAGPADAALPAECRPHDRNGDGRVDLREVSALQLAYAGTSR